MTDIKPPVLRNPVSSTTVGRGEAARPASKATGTQSGATDVRNLRNASVPGVSHERVPSPIVGEARVSSAQGSMAPRASRLPRSSFSAPDGRLHAGDLPVGASLHLRTPMGRPASAEPPRTPLLPSRKAPQPLRPPTPPAEVWRPEGSPRAGSPPFLDELTPPPSPSGSEAERLGRGLPMPVSPRLSVSKLPRPVTPGPGPDGGSRETTRPPRDPSPPSSPGREAMAAQPQSVPRAGHAPQAVRARSLDRGPSVRTGSGVDRVLGGPSLSPARAATAPSTPSVEARRRSSASAGERARRAAEAASMATLAKSVRHVKNRDPAEWNRLQGDEVEIVENFLLHDHLKAISVVASAEHRNVAVSVRETGKLTLKRLAQGALPKPHHMLEKTIKDSSVVDDCRTEAAVALARAAGRWKDGALEGVYLTHDAARATRITDPELRKDFRDRLRETEDGRLFYAVDPQHLDHSLKALRAAGDWERLPATSDEAARHMAKEGYRAQAVQRAADVQAADIEGHVGYRENGVLMGLYVSPEVERFQEGQATPGQLALKARLRHTPQGKAYYPVDRDRLTDSLADLKAADPAEEGWHRLIYTGDYDLHDLISYAGQAAPVPSDSQQEQNYLLSFNVGIGAVDDLRPVGIDDLHSVQHGPQYSYEAHMRAMEPGKPIVRKVAQPSFPLAMCDNRGKWTVIRNLDGLQDFYDGIRKGMLKNNWAAPRPASPPRASSPATSTASNRRSSTEQARVGVQPAAAAGGEAGASVPPRSLTR